MKGSVQLLQIIAIRKDGNTQCRCKLSPAVVHEYASHMAEGDEFPPISVWFDETQYWLSDGFHRIAAAEKLGHSEILAEIRCGTLEDARWHSYGCNSSHGLRRTASEIVTTIQCALQHPAAAGLSNRELARHLKIPEATFRRLVRRLSASGGADNKMRIVHRNGTRYEMDTTSIGRCATAESNLAKKSKSLKQLATEFMQMKQKATPEVESILNIVAKWAFGPATPTDCLTALERVKNRWQSAEVTLTATRSGE
jgi:DNA-binding Lrp family transcriptional regulator